MKEKMFARIMKDNCPICDVPLNTKETEVVDYDEHCKLEVHKLHIKYKRN